MMPGMLTENTSGVMCSFLECVSIFESSDLKYKSMISLLHLLSALILFHEMFVVMMKIIAFL